jgi:hypothetical protein
MIKIRTIAKNKLNYIPNGFILFKRTNLNLLKTVEKKYCLIFNFGIGELFYLLKDLLILYNEIVTDIIYKLFNIIKNIWKNKKILL